jgi:hypothetical protein
MRPHILQALWDLFFKVRFGIRKGEEYPCIVK